MSDTRQLGTHGVNAEGWGEPQSKTVVWHDPIRTAAAGAELTGLDFLTAIRDGKLGAPPIALPFGMRMVEIEPGRVVFECELDESVYNPIGMVHGGLACTLADTVIGCAVHHPRGGWGIVALGGHRQILVADLVRGAQRLMRYVHRHRDGDGSLPAG